MAGAILLLVVLFILLFKLSDNEPKLSPPDSATIYPKTAKIAKDDYLRADSAVKRPVTERDRADYRRAIRQRDSIRKIEGFP